MKLFICMFYKFYIGLYRYKDLTMRFLGTKTLDKSNLKLKCIIIYILTHCLFIVNKQLQISRFYKQKIWIKLL